MASLMTQIVFGQNVMHIEGKMFRCSALLQTHIYHEPSVSELWYKHASNISK
jgi:hypothetical protein